MYYLLVFLGLVALAVIVAMSPLVFRLLEYILPIAESEGVPAKAASSQSIERSEMRDEIRVLTAALESRGGGRVKGLH
jgi:hypothetical protein